MCCLVMLPAAVTQQNHYSAEEGKWNDLEASRMKKERSVGTIIFGCGETVLNVTACVCVCKFIHSFIKDTSLRN